MAGLPTNSGRAKDQGCNPVSSNCVVWQGPDLECIGLCKGDTISDVLAKMATELCTLVDMFDLSEFDFTCLSVPISEQPKDMGDLIQILIDRICILEGLDPITPGGSTGDCPENCIVPIATCFFFIDPQGDTVTTMTLIDYVTAIGNKICDILTDIIALQTQIDTLNTQVNGDGSGDPIVSPAGLTGEVGDIKTNYTPRSELNYQLNSQTLPPGDVVFITDAVRAIENKYLTTLNGVGEAVTLYQNFLKEGSFGEQNTLAVPGIYNNISGWTVDVQNAGQSIGNLWLALRDIYAQIAYISENCCSTGCAELLLNFTASLAGPILTVFTNGSTGFTPEWGECDNDTLITVTDANGNATTFRTSLLIIIDQPGGYSVDLSPTGLDLGTNLDVSAATCFFNTASETQCEKEETYLIINSALCPAVILSIQSTSVGYQFTSTNGFTYIVNIYYNTGSVAVASQIIATPGVTVLSSISGLTSNTDYEFELIVLDGEGNETPCPRQLFTTLLDNCQPPINAVAILTIP